MRSSCSKLTMLCEQLWTKFSKNNCQEFTCFEKLHSRNLQLYQKWSPLRPIDQK